MADDIKGESAAGPCLENGESHYKMVTTTTTTVTNNGESTKSVVVKEHQSVGEPNGIVGSQLITNIIPNSGIAVNPKGDEQQHSAVSYTIVTSESKVVDNRSSDSSKNLPVVNNPEIAKQETTVKHQEDIASARHVIKMEQVDERTEQQEPINRKEAAMLLEKMIQGRRSPLPAKVEPQRNLSEQSKQKRKIEEAKVGELEQQSARSDSEPLSETAGYGLEDKNVAENEPQIRTDVHREADTNDEHEYPEQGLTKSLLSKFKNKEFEKIPIQREEVNPSTGVSIKQISTQLKEQPHRNKLDLSRAVDLEDEISEAKGGGVFESEPIIREDVAKENQRNDEEELPPVGLTKNLLSAFKELQKSGESTPIKQRSRGGSTSSISDYLNLYQQSSGGSLSENTPTLRSDVVRESDTAEDPEERPVEGTTKNLLGMFTKVNENTKKMHGKLHKPSGIAKTQWKPKNPLTTPSKRPVAPLPSSSDTPAQSKDIAREDDGQINEEELPKSGCAKGLLQKFKTMGSSDISSTDAEPKDKDRSSDIKEENQDVPAGNKQGGPTTPGGNTSMLSKFKQMEKEERKAVPHKPSAAARKPLRNDSQKI